jgi:hypothetical protein
LSLQSKGTFSVVFFWGFGVAGPLGLEKWRTLNTKKNAFFFEKKNFSALNHFSKKIT